MHRRFIVAGSGMLAAASILFGLRKAAAQQDEPPRSFPTSPQPGRPEGGPGGPGFGGGPMGQQERKLVKQFDKNNDHRLNSEERAAAREFLKESGGNRRGPRGFGRGNDAPVEAGPKIEVSEAATYPKAPLYDPSVLRTIFFEFEDKDWEAQLADFYNTDVEVPATLTVDGVRYPNVGVHFRGASSFFMVSAGHKRSFNVSMDFADSKQRLYGASTLNLLNAHEDASFMSTVLYSTIARRHIPAPKANFVKIVINGESWGVYVSAQQFNSDFVAENFGSQKGARWKVSGSPNGRGGLDYIGDNIDGYKARYEMKSGGDKDWHALIELCRTLSETPLDKLESALKPMLDIDSALWFLALDNGLINNDGYWVRASDYSIYRDPKGVFHLIPHDMNEAFVAAMGGPGGGMGPGGPGFGPPGGGRPGGPGGDFDGPRGPGGQQGPPGDRPREAGSPPNGDNATPRPAQPRDAQPQNGQPSDRQRQPGGPPGGFGPGRGAGYELDPLIGMNDTRKPLRSRMLAVPGLRAKYLANIRAIAQNDLAWARLGPVVAQFRTLIESDIKADTRKLTTTESFLLATADQPDAQAPQGRGPRMVLRQFADKRSAYLSGYSEPEPNKPQDAAPDKKESDR